MFKSILEAPGSRVVYFQTHRTTLHNPVRDCREQRGQPDLYADVPAREHAPDPRLELHRGALHDLLLLDRLVAQERDLWISAESV